MRVTGVTFEREESGDTVWTVWTIPSEKYRAGMTEREAASVALRFRDYASAPDARGVEGPSEMSADELATWKPSD